MKKIIGLLVVCILLMQASAWAADWGALHKKGPNKRGMMDCRLKLQQALKLTDQQIKELQSRSFAFQKEAVKERAAIATALIELKEIRAQDSIDIKKAEAKIRQIAGLQADMKIARMKQIEEGKTVLTPEQKDTLKKLKMRPMMRGNHASEFTLDEEMADLSPEVQDEITYLEEVFEISLLPDQE